MFCKNLLTACCLLLAAGSYAQTLKNEHLRAIIDAEHNFAHKAHDESMKAAFTANLDSSGIVVNGNDFVNGLELYSTAKTDTTSLLLWYPEYAQVNDRETFGFTSGPYHYYASKKDKPVASGYFFSVWKKDGSGKFKVMFDGGVTHPVPNGDFLSAQAMQSDFKLINSIANNTNDGSLYLEALNDGIIRHPEKALKYLAPNALVLRPGKFAINSSGSLNMYKADSTINFIHLVKGGGYDDSKSMYYCYGSMAKDAASAQQGKYCGYFVQVWQKRRQGWQLSADVKQY
ncbi:hypothetical protein ACFQZX_03720 [Mucilaginibacter litoreus]|uniref:DUF4440 domain-containing protein n=1 Tax=Mucilaginibacter litoreus TaxID=1048221 RepID=A0ABW3APE8_9SPHI